MDSLAQIFVLLLFIYLMFGLMKYIFKLLFGAAIFGSASKNTVWHYMLKPLRAIFNFGDSGMMGSFEERRFLSPLHKGLLLDGQNKRLSEADSFNHIALIARTGGGKTSSYIIPNIFKLANEKNSMIVTDLSGELYEKTSGYLQRKGFKVYVLDPEDLNSSIGYNPLYYALSSIEIDEIAQILIRSANPGQIKAEDKMWLDGAKTLLSILIKTLIGTKDHRVINLANLRYLLNNFGEDGTKLDSFIYTYSDEKNFSEWKGFVSGNLKTVQSFLSTANIALSAIGINDNLALLTANHTINFENFRKEKSILYIRIPQQKQEQYGFLLNLFYKQFFNTMMNKLPSKNDLPVYCLLDEFGNMSIPSFSSTVTTIRKYKVSISIVIQSFRQIEEKYGKNDAYTIINGGITAKLFYAGADYEISEMLSRMIGERYINKIDEFGKTHHLRESILSSAQIRTMKDNEVLLIYGNKLPLKLTVKPYFKDFVLKSYTKIAPVQKKAYFSLNEIVYVNLDME